jgi:hypothetical protein
MKKNILTLLGLFLVTVSFAQFTYGPKLGGNVSRLSGDKLMPGFQAGGFVNAELDDRIGVQVDFLWTLKGNKHVVTDSNYVNTPATTYTITTKTYYRFVDVPICVYFPISKHIRGFAGPQISVFRKAKETTKSSLGGTPVKKDLTGIAGKVSLCAGIDLVLDSPIIIGVRFVTNKFTGGTASAQAGGDDAKDDKSKLNCFMLNVAYRMDW